MKTKLVPAVVVLLVALFTLTLPNLSNGQEAKQPKKELVNTTILFYNPEDHPPAPAFLTIRFIAISEKGLADTTTWHKEITEKLEKLGGVHGEEDCKKKVGPIMVDYIERFMGTGATAIIVEFPRERTGFLLAKPK